MNTTTYWLMTHTPVNTKMLIGTLLGLLLQTLVMVGLLRLLYGLVPGAWSAARKTLVFLTEHYRTAPLSRSGVRGKA